MAAPPMAIEACIHGARMMNGMCVAASNMDILAQRSCSPSCQPWLPSAAVGRRRINMRKKYRIGPKVGPTSRR